MRIGILCEGKYDRDTIKIIISRIVKKIKPDTRIIFQPYRASGGILNKVHPAIEFFFGSVSHQCDLAVFITDIDNDRIRCNKIRKLVRNYQLGENPSATMVVGCCDPTLEQWFLKEEVSLKKILNLDPQKGLPFSELSSPKIRLNKIIRTYENDITKSKLERYNDLAESIDLELLVKRDKNFKKFVNDLTKEIKRL